MKHKKFLSLMILGPGTISGFGNAQDLDQPGAPASQDPACTPLPTDGVIPEGAHSYTTANDCSGIKASGSTYVASFEFRKLKSITCSGVEYLLVDMLAPGYQPRSQILTFKASDLIFYH